MNYIVTTKPSPTPNEEAMGKALAKRLKLRYFDRRNSTINYLSREAGAGGALVVKGSDIEFIKDGRRFYFHPNIAALRVIELEKGNTDRLLKVIGISPGDSVLDCTCGLASDSIVLSWGVGSKGRITSLESSPIVYEIVNSGLKNYKDKKYNLRKVMDRIKLINCNYLDYLSKLKENSFDFIYFDPMFENSMGKSQGLDIIKELANYQPLTKEGINLAKRVAKKGVVVKTDSQTTLLKDLELPVIFKKSKVSYGKTTPNIGTAPLQ